MKVGILYNYVDNISKGLDSDKISDNEIVDTVDHVYNHLKDKHEVIPIRVSKNFLSNFNPDSLDIMFNLCEGFEGDSAGEARVASFLELMKIPYTGNSSYTLELCQDKYKAKQLMISNKIPTPKFFLFEKEHLIEENYNKLKLKLKYPLIIKPSREDASVGITDESIVYDEEGLKKRLEFVINTYKQPAIVEEYIDGKEYYIPIIGNGENIQVLPIVEVAFLKGEKIFTFNRKWETESPEYNDTDMICPAKVPAKLYENIKKIAIDIYKISDCRDYARIDFRVKGNKAYVIEVNPNPTLNRSPCFYGSAKKAGISHKQLINKILEFAINRNGFRKKIETNFEFSSEKVTLRNVKLSELDSLVEWFNNPQINKYQDNPELKVSKQGLFESYFRYDNLDYNLIIYDKNTENKIGHCSIYDITQNSAEISFLIGDNNFQNDEYISEIIKTVISIAKEILKLDFVYCRMVEKNTEHIKIIEENGFEKTGIRYNSHFLEDNMYNELVYTKRLN